MLLQTRDMELNNAESSRLNIIGGRFLFLQCRRRRYRTFPYSQRRTAMWLKRGQDNDEEGDERIETLVNCF